jgi:phosphoribosylanthranilate isomerase
MVSAAGADAIGLNFYPSSPRYVAPSDAFTIARTLPANVAKVGVFVNSGAEQIARIVDEVGLDCVQLHGDEPPEILQQLHPLPVIRAFRLSHRDCDQVVRYVDRCQELACWPQAILIDAFRPGQYGGTGATLDWTRLDAVTTIRGRIPVVLAGGLTADNVAQAITVARPDAVDTASGVEQSPGKKDPSLVRRFVAAARRALQSNHIR